LPFNITKRAFVGFEPNRAFCSFQYTAILDEKKEKSWLKENQVDPLSD
jgi:hypothetical protein